MRVLALAFETFLVTASLAAHPGHGSEVVTGTLKSVTEDAIYMEIRDQATMQMRRLRILVTEDTKFRIGKEPVDSPESMVGSFAAVAVDYEDDPSGKTIYTATDVRFRKPKD